MATVRDICLGGLRKIGVLALGEEADADMAQEALDAYNGIMHGARAGGWLATFTTQGFNDTFPLGDEVAEPAKAAVAEQIAGSFDRQVPMRLAQQARQFQGWLAAQADHAATFERGFRYEEPDMDEAST